MKLLSRTLNIRKPFVLGSFLITLFSILTFALPVYAQAKLSLGDIFTGLRSKKVTIEERNRLLTDAVKNRGITFAVTPEIEKELEGNGGSKDLIVAIKQKSAVVAPVVMTTPVPTPVPISVPTPAPTPKEPEYVAFQKKADSNFVKGEYDIAVINYTKAAELNPKEASIYLSRGLIYYNRKLYELAVTDYTKAIEIEPKETNAYYYRGDSFEKLGEFEKAAADYKKVLELDASNENAKVYLQRVEAELSKLQRKANVATNVVQAEPKTETDAKPNPTSDENKPAEPAKVLEFVELGSLIPFSVKLIQPSYPPNLRNLQIGGSVTVNVTIDEQGKPISVKATSGNPGLRNASEEAVKRSTFKPAMINNQPVKSKGFVTFNF